MSLYPLCLMPQVIVSQGQAQMPLSPGSDAEYGSVHDVVAAFAEQGAAWVHVADKDAASGQGQQLRGHRPGGRGPHPAVRASRTNRVSRRRCRPSPPGSSSRPRT